MSSAPFDLSKVRIVWGLAPAVLLSVSILSSLLLTIPPLNRILHRTCSPLRNFLHLEDLAEYNSTALKRPSHSAKNILLICISFVHGAVWCADASYSVMVSGPTYHVLVASTTAAAWVRTYSAHQLTTGLFFSYQTDIPGPSARYKTSNHAALLPAHVGSYPNGVYIAESVERYSTDVA